MLKYITRKNHSFLYCCCFFLLSIIVILNAWITEDAYITFRVIDNFINGYGLRWNIDERVQVYTHPLWMMLVTPFYYIFGNIFITTCLLSIAVSLISVFIITKNKTSQEASVLFIIILALSKSFVEFATSGLENCLSYLLFAIFIANLKQKPIRWFWLSFIASLAVVNRLDVIVIYLPIFIYLIALNRKKCEWIALIKGSTPLILWEIFSLFYYGFLFPNTKYAKLNTGISQEEYFGQGINYVIDFFARDLVSLLVIIFSFILVLIVGFKRQNQQSGIISAIALGNFFYILYVITIGGDFMSGRFFALPLFISAYLIYEITLANKFCQNHKILIYCLVGSLIYLRLFFIAIPAMAVVNKYGIADKKMWYKDNRLIDLDKMKINQDVSYHMWFKEALKDKNNGQKYQAIDNIGIYGYYSAPDKILIDHLALSDPFLARIPMSRKNGEKWRIGHFYRDIPQGYIEARVNGDFSKMSPDMAIYYKKIHQIVSGELLSFDRIKTIIDFNLGKYD